MIESRKPKVRYEEMLPHELEEAVAKFPVAYCPFGSLEWHGKHLPLGNDSLKAYGILILTAEKFGGVVIPPTYWGFNRKWHPWTMNFFDTQKALVEELYERIFLGLVDVGFKVIIGVTGHDHVLQKDAMESAVDSIRKTYRKATGFAMYEGELYDFTDAKMDHAGQWETSLMMYLRPELVDMERIKDEDLESEEGREKAGVYGRDPRKYASRELGEKIANRLAERIGQKAQELLATLKK